MTTEILLHAPPHARADTPPVDAVRAFVFLSGLRWMREQGYEERVLRFLDVRFHDMSSGVSAGEWVPVEDALAIYAALDETNLPLAEQLELGRYVALANNGVIISTISRLAGKLGVSPWAVLSRLHSVWLRNNRGGAVAIYKLGERSARLEFWAVPFARSDFFRTSLCGSLAAALEAMAPTVRVKELSELRTDDAFALQASW